MAQTVINVGGHYIGEGYPVFLIAEVGINHNGDLQVAKRLMDAAFACSWNAVKFQKRTPDLAVPEAQKTIMRDTPWGRIPYLEYRYKVEFEQAEYDLIDQYCKEKPLLWTASVWDSGSLHFMANYDVAFIKIPSAKLTEQDLLIEACKTEKPLILSSGMSTIDEIDKAINLLEKHSKGNYVLMHTNSTYPTPPEDINLKIISFLQERYQCIVGYSGHEYDLEPSVIATVLGAKVIERHVTLDHTMWGSDQFASLEVHAMDMLAKRIRAVEKILGDGKKRLTESEIKVRNKLRGY